MTDGRVDAGTCQVFETAQIQLQKQQGSSVYIEIQRNHETYLLKQRCDKVEPRSRAGTHCAADHANVVGNTQEFVSICPADTKLSDIPTEV